MAADQIWMKCPFFPMTKFGEVVEPAPAVVEIDCRTCRKAAARSGLIVQVIHVFRLTDGECIDTREQYREKPVEDPDPI